MSVPMNEDKFVHQLWKEDEWLADESHILITWAFDSNNGFGSSLCLQEAIDCMNYLAQFGSRWEYKDGSTCVQIRFSEKNSGVYQEMCERIEFIENHACCHYVTYIIAKEVNVDDRDVPVSQNIKTFFEPRQSHNTHDTKMVADYSGVDSTLNSTHKPKK